MLLEIEFNAKIRIYKNTNNNFSLFQTLTPSDGSANTQAGAITDDSQWVVFGTWNASGIVDVYKLEDQEYKINQTLLISNYVVEIALTQDHSFLVVGTRGNVHVYKHNGTQFNPFQILNFSLSGHKFVSMTDDHQELTVTHWTSKLYRYQYNQASHKFELFLNNGTI